MSKLIVDLCHKKESINDACTKKNSDIQNLLLTIIVDIPEKDFMVMKEARLQEICVNMMQSHLLSYFHVK